MQQCSNKHPAGILGDTEAVCIPGPGTVGGLLLLGGSAGTPGAGAGAGFGDVPLPPPPSGSPRPAHGIIHVGETSHKGLSPRCSITHSQAHSGTFLYLSKGQTESPVCLSRQLCFLVKKSETYNRLAYGREK